MDPEVIALRDKEEFEVQAILDDTIDVDTPTRSWRFHVLWKGYDISEASWVSWNTLKDVGILHEYLRSKRLGKFIPRSHQKPQDRTKRSQPQNSKPQKKSRS